MKSCRFVVNDIARRNLARTGLLWAIGSIALCVVSLAGNVPAAEMTLELTVGSQTVEGMPLAWDQTYLRLLGRDGRLWTFRLDEVRDFRVAAEQFRPYSVSQLRAALLRELGPGYDVASTSHYLVAYPAGQPDRWSQQFEEMYRCFVHYFTVRGFRVQQPPFPLLAVVCRDRQQFERMAPKSSAAAMANVHGWYSVESNRIVVYDMAGQPAAQSQLDAVILHEAAHQAAFNVGIHNRFAPTPAWLAEGLATMFEAPGVYDSRRRPLLADRINQQRLADFRHTVVPNSRGDLLPALIGSDELFVRQPAAAYATAWALCFYLTETQPDRFARYLARTAARPALAEYPPQQRTADFTAVFGDQWPMLEARLLRFIAELR